jgi:hypothetical protein
MFSGLIHNEQRINQAVFVDFSAGAFRRRTSFICASVSCIWYSGDLNFIKLTIIKVVFGSIGILGIQIEKNLKTVEFHPNTLEILKNSNTETHNPRNILDYFNLERGF